MPEKKQYTILRDFKSMEEAQAWGEKYLKPNIDLLVMPVDFTNCKDGAVVKVKTELISEKEFQTLSAAMGTNSLPKLTVTAPVLAPPAASSVPTPSASKPPDQAVKAPERQRPWWKFW